jgi:hypothetical protein
VLFDSIWYRKSSGHNILTNFLTVLSSYLRVAPEVLFIDLYIFNGISTATEYISANVADCISREFPRPNVTPRRVADPSSAG